jgi:dTDP-4-dehydrorhamnose reductase
MLDILPKIENSETQIYHFSNEGVSSWYDFAVAIMEMSGLACEVIPIPSSQYPTPAKRPFYSVMDKSKIKKEFDIKIAHWKESLKECLDLLA